MTRSDLVEELAARFAQLTHRDAESAVKTILDAMSDAVKLTMTAFTSAKSERLQRVATRILEMSRGLVEQEMQDLEGQAVGQFNAQRMAMDHARDTSFVFVSRAPIAALEAYRKRMGWAIPWYSSYGTTFNPDFGRGPETPQPDQHQDGEMFGMSAFIRDGDTVYRTYFTTHRGVETLGPVWTLLDLTALGRQEEWEDSPEGTPQTPPYEWWRRHDEYGR